MKPKIRIDFCDLGINRSKTRHFLYRLLSERFELELCDQPDFLVHNVFGHTHRLFSGVRILFTDEAELPDFRISDYTVTPYALDDPRHLHLPAYAQYGTGAEIVKRHDDPAALLAAKNKFCSFVVTGFNARKNWNRLDIFNALSRHKRVDSGGRFMNNIGGPVPGGAAGKLAFLRDFKFNVAYENASRRGYTTEKIFEAMAARCIPIYWGDPMINEQFNPRSFLNRADFPSDEALVEKVIELDQDDAKWLEIMRQPFLPKDEPTLYFSRERMLNFFERIFTTPIQPVGKRRRWFQIGRWLPVKRHPLHPFPPETSGT